MEKSVEFNISTFYLFIKSAYISVKRDKILEALGELHIPAKHINFIKVTIKQVSVLLKYRMISQTFLTLVDSCRKAYLLFSIALEKTLRSAVKLLDVI